ncbi:cyclase [Mycolicibacterium goodii]|uniref:SRPBCC family protein n=1 Tax=Mycolicibacterium goodii TaxID=134601 RepID=UPI001F041390|nr:SRPBCC family protein [Mycolicibacterium goodii]ULN46848.1 cyclase [Mycolicibacterium goodii]
MARQDSSRSNGGTATDTLRDAGQQLLGVMLQRAASSATDRVADFSDRLTNVAENGEGLRSLVRRPDRHDRDDGDDGDDGDGGDGKGSGLGSMLGGLKDKVQNALGGGSKGGKGGKKKLKLTNIVETLDVGVPLRTTYDLWTQFTEFPTFMKKVESVTQPEDEVTQWKAQVFFSHREWEATILEQVPDSHIVWRSKGAKGHVDGAVTFAALAPNLTRVALVMEYHPQGLFERTGNLWRAQGRRARLELKHFGRHAMTQTLLHPEEIEGWRGEIHDGEVVKTHEEALEEEQSGRGDEQDYEEPSEPEDYGDEGDEGYEEQDEDEGADEDAGDYEEDYLDEDADEDYDTEPDEGEDYETEDYADEDNEGEDYADEDYEDEEEPPSRSRGRRTVGAGGGRRGGRS